MCLVIIYKKVEVPITRFFFWKSQSKDISSNPLKNLPEGNKNHQNGLNLKLVCHLRRTINMYNDFENPQSVRF